MKGPVKKEFSDFICGPYCIFFKAGQKEDMACGGALAVMRLIADDLLSIDDFPEPSNAPAAPDSDPLLLELVCRSCPFMLDGCDFRLPMPPADAVACGGLILLGLLYDSRMLTTEALRTIAHE